MAYLLRVVSALAPVLVLFPTWHHLVPNALPSQPKLVTPLYMHNLTKRSYEKLGNESLQHL